MAAKLYFYNVTTKIMTRVLLINKLFEPVIGGVETVVAQIAQGLGNDKNFKTTILAGNEKLSFANKYYTWNNAGVCKTASLGTIYNTALSINYPLALHALIQSHDVFHFHVPNPLGELSFFFNKIPANKKVIVTVYADVRQTKRKFYAPAYNFFLKKLLKRADVITTMSPQNRDGFPILQPFLNKIVIVPIAYDGRHIKEVTALQKAAFINKFNIDATKKIVLFVGRLSEEKGLPFLIDAVAKMDNVQLIIAGDGYLKESLLQQSKELACDNIVFTGFIDHHDMACAYSLADVFVLPSTSETFGIVQAEAMRFGVPVINTALNTGVNYVSLNNDTGLTVAPKNADALASAINTIINDDDLRSKFSKNALQRSEMFTPERMVDSFKNLYLSV